MAEQIPERYARLEQMTDEQLEDILRAHIRSDTDDGQEMVAVILELLEKREIERPSGKVPDLEQAWTDFNTYYNTEDGKGEAVFPVSDD